MMEAKLDAMKYQADWSASQLQAAQKSQTDAEKALEKKLSEITELTEQLGVVQQQSFNPRFSNPLSLSDRRSTRTRESLVRREEEKERIADMLTYTQELLQEEVSNKQALIQEIEQLQLVLKEKEEQIEKLKASALPEA